MIRNSKKIIIRLLAAVSIAFLLSACSSGGDSGGSTSGTGSSTVEGNITSVQVALNQAVETDYTLADFFRSLRIVQPVEAGSEISDISVEIAGMRTVTDSNGYFKIAGVPPGTHQVQFSKSGVVSNMSVDVGTDEQVYMQNINIQGSRSKAQRVNHTPHNNNPQTPTNPGTPGTPGTPDDTHPNTPSTPGTPDDTHPNTPDTPGTPDDTHPGTPGTPGVPDDTHPDTPGTTTPGNPDDHTETPEINHR